MKDRQTRRAAPTLPPGRFKTLYDRALEPPKESTGTPYHVSQSTLDVVSTPPKAKQKHRSLSEKEAAWEVALHNDVIRATLEGSAEKEAISRLDKIFSNLSPGVVGPDIIYKTFRDLDVVFFCGQLFRHVDVRWSPNVTHMAVYGHVEPGENGTAHIIMDAKKVFLECREQNPYKEMFETLLHEMTVLEIAKLTV